MVNITQADNPFHPDAVGLNGGGYAIVWQHDWSSLDGDNVASACVFTMQREWRRPPMISSSIQPQQDHNSFHASLSLATAASSSSGAMSCLIAWPMSVPNALMKSGTKSAAKSSCRLIWRASQTSLMWRKVPMDGSPSPLSLMAKQAVTACALSSSSRRVSLNPLLQVAWWPS